MGRDLSPPSAAQRFPIGPNKEGAFSDQQHDEHRRLASFEDARSPTSVKQAASALQHFFRSTPPHANNEEKALVLSISKFSTMGADEHKIRPSFDILHSKTPMTIVPAHTQPHHHDDDDSSSSMSHNISIQQHQEQQLGIGELHMLPPRAASWHSSEFRRSSTTTTASHTGISYQEHLYSSSSSSSYRHVEEVQQAPAAVGPRESSLSPPCWSKHNPLSPEKASNPDDDKNSLHAFFSEPLSADLEPRPLPPPSK
jgi:hypothetical protein